MRELPSECPMRDVCLILDERNSLVQLSPEDFRELVLESADAAENQILKVAICSKNNGSHCPFWREALENNIGKEQNRRLRSRL